MVPIFLSSTLLTLVFHIHIYHASGSVALFVVSEVYIWVLPCQNSTTSGTIRRPPQNGGTGISFTS